MNVETAEGSSTAGSSKGICEFLEREAAARGHSTLEVDYLTFRSQRSNFYASAPRFPLTDPSTAAGSKMVNSKYGRITLCEAEM
jgi:hypothetical protein